LKRKSVEKEQQNNTSVKNKNNGGNNSEQKRAKKQMNFPQIKSSERCGKCKTCLNPQMRKACLTRRAEMVTIGGVKQAPSPPLPRAVTTPAPATMATVTTLDAFVVRSNDYEVID